MRWELLRDLAALTGFEPLTSDGWGVVKREGDGEPAVFERIAAVSTREDRLALAQDPEIAVPRVITTQPYLSGRTYDVDLVADGSLSG